MLKFSVIIPVYKSTTSLEIIAESFKELQEEQTYVFEIIFVNDSPFALETAQTLEKLKKS
jgi:glycosyltransferase involved in cell wall biosynthesis